LRDVSDAPETLEVPFQLSVADVRHGFVRTLLAQTPGLRALPLAWAAALAVLAVACRELARGTLQVAPPVVLFLLLALGFVVGVPAAIQTLAASSLRKAGGGEGRWRFRDDALQVQLGRTLQTLPWVEIHTLTVTRRAYLVHPRPGAFQLLPRRGLGAETEARIEAFLARAPRAKPFFLGWMSPAALISLAMGAYLAWTWLGRP
ncbi:MAG: YcxB family protein, partial [Myxococcota bacterium]